MNGRLIWLAISAIVIVFLYTWFTQWHPVQTWQLSASSNVIAISTDGQLLATSSGAAIKRTKRALNIGGSSKVELRNLSDGSIVRTIDAFSVHRLTFSPDRSLIAAGNNLGEIQVWHTNDGQPLYSHDLLINLKHTDINNLTFSPDGQNLISGIGDKVDVWNASNGQHRYSLLNKGTFSLSPDGQILAIGNSNLPISLYRLSDGTILRQLEINGYPQFSPDGQLLAIAGSSSYERKYEDKIILYRLQDDKLVGDLSLKRFGRFAFSPDSRYVATAYATGGGGKGDIFGYYPSSEPRYSHLVLWQLVRFRDRYYPQKIRHVKTKKDYSYSPLAFSPDGKILASGGDKKISLWQMPLLHPWLFKLLLIIGFSGIFFYVKRFLVRS